MRSKRVPLPGGLEKPRMLAHASSARACDWQQLRVCRGGGAGGADCLESVAVGDGVSTAPKPFVIKDCPALKTLVVGNDSFSGCSSCVLQSLPMLESVQFGTMESDEKRGCFRSASLEVRSMCWSEFRSRFACAEEASAGKWQFRLLQ